MHYLFSFENIIIQICIAIPLFFLIRSSLKGFIKHPRYKNFTTLLASLILAPIINVGLIYLLIVAIGYEPKLDFDKKIWFAGQNDRFKMADNIVSSRILIGKDANQVLETLGKPSSGDSANWIYSMGMGGGGLGFTFHNLIIKFNADTVASVFHNRIQD